ncbi:MAG TPA: hypothetical protein PKM15_08300, partial [bacterium]|nr:hypothetical protein [bacterium]
MKKILIVIVLMLLFCSISALTVEDVQVEGNIRTESSVLTRPFTQGKEFSEEEIDKILKEVIDLAIFQDISVFYSPEKKTLIFKVIEFPIIKEVTVSGNKKIDLEDINEVVTVKKNELLDTAKINRNTT